MSNELITISIEQWQQVDGIVETIRQDLEEESRPSYEGDINQFLMWAEEQSRINPFHDPYEAFVAYKDHLRDDYKASTANKKLAAVRKFFKVAFGKGLLTFNQWAGIEATKNIPDRGKPLRNWLSEDEAHQLLNTPDTTTEIGRRDKVALMLMLVLGLRESEVVSVTWSQVDMREGFYVLKDILGKGNKYRSVKIPAQYIDILREYAKDHYAANEPILSHYDKYGNRYPGLSKRAINIMVEKYAAPLGLDVSPHDLRRTFATLAHDNGDGASMEQLRQALGHTEERTTRKYLEDQFMLHNNATDFIDI